MVRNKLHICKEYHIQPSEIDKMAFFEYEWILEDIKHDVEEQEKRQKEQEKNQKAPNYKMPNYSQMMSSAQSSIPKISTPKF